MKCRFCDSFNIHTSRWQGQDFLMLPLLLLPMRCHACTKRDYRNMFLVLVLKVRSSERRRRRKWKQHAEPADRKSALPT